MADDETKFDATVNLADVVDNPAALTAAIEGAAAVAERRTWDDPEWTEPRCTMLKEIVAAFLVGIVRADAWFTDYTLPPNLELVANLLSAAVIAKCGVADELTHLSLLDIQAFYREFIDGCAEVKAWNDYPGSGFVTRYSATPAERTFIDLDALIQNACNFIRNDRREFDEFNADFDARHPAEDGKGE